MKHLQIKNFGFVTHADLKIRKVTVIAGDSSGIAVLVVMLAELEAYLSRSQSSDPMSLTDIFLCFYKKYSLQSFFTSHTIVDYFGDTCHILIKGEQVKVDKPNQDFNIGSCLYLSPLNLTESLHRWGAANCLSHYIAGKEVNIPLAAAPSNIKLATLLSKIHDHLLMRESKICAIDDMGAFLSPESQKQMLYKFLSLVNTKIHYLFLTTQSPYILNALALAIKGSHVLNKVKSDTYLSKKINSIVPIAACIQVNNVAIYEMKDGSIKPLATVDGLPTDENFLNKSLASANDLFNNLLEIEEAIDCS